MDRLTRRVGDKVVDVPNKYFNLTHEELVHELFNRLANYEDLEEQGLLLRLPCKVGDAVYSHSQYFGILAYEINSISICCGMSFESIASRDDEMLDTIDFEVEDIGKTVFLTREQAEEKLKEMENGSKL